MEIRVGLLMLIWGDSAVIAMPHFNLYLPFWKNKTPAAPGGTWTHFGILSCGQTSGAAERTGKINEHKNRVELLLRQHADR